MYHLKVTLYHINPGEIGIDNFVWLSWPKILASESSVANLPKLRWNPNVSNNVILDNVVPRMIRSRHACMLGYYY